MSEEHQAPRSAGRGGITRRRALIGGGAAVVIGGGAATAVAIAGRHDGGSGSSYPRVAVARVSDLSQGTPVTFDYPLQGQQSILLDMGEAVPGGVGGNQSIVAYSILCQHMGCPVGHVPDGGYLLCGCHQSRYDPARLGTVVQGVAQMSLPRILLEVDGDDVLAVGVDGLIYGYRHNLAPGQQAD